MTQLGSLGGGNHFIELQKDAETGMLFIQVHTGSRGFGHGLATNYFDLARAERPELGKGAEKSAYSVNHGAGRKLSRGKAIRTLNQSEIDAEYRREGILVNTDGRVPIDESSACYKGSEEVIHAVTAAGLARIEHRLWPLASIKGSDERKIRNRKREKARKGERHTSDPY